MKQKQESKQKQKERKQKERKPTRAEELAARVERDHAHLNSAVIASKQRVLQFEAEEVDKSVAMLGAALAQQKEHRVVIDAMLRGLAMVVAKRC